LPVLVLEVRQEEMTTMSNNEPVRLSHETLKKCLWRYLWVRQSPFNYETMQSGGWVWGIDPAMQELYGDDPDLLASKYEEHFKFFNSHPWMNNIIMGACLAIESTKDPDATRTAVDLRTALMGPLAGLGDSLIWILLKSIVSAIAAYMAMDGSTLGIWIAFVTQWVIWGLFYKGFYVAYDKGVSFITERRAQLDHVTDAAQVIGLAVVGAMVASTVSVEFGMTFTIGELERNLNDLLDSIIPHFGNVLAVFLIYKGLQNPKLSSGKMVLIVLIISMLLSIIGILA
jgi:PTS system mannose-specific IID component